MRATVNNLPDPIQLDDGLTISREAAIAVAGHMLAIHRLLFGDNDNSLDLAFNRLNDLLSGGNADRGDLADELLAAAIETGASA